MKTGIVDVGGGFRGVYACGVLDRCMDDGVRFDLGIGVSAGSANLASFAAGQRGRNLRFYTEYGLRKEYAGIRNFLRSRSYIDLDYVYGTLSRSGGESPLDYRALSENPMEFYIAATDAQTGLPRYFDKSDIHQDDYDVFKASSAIPFVCRPYPVQGKPYFDGALGDPIPMEEAFRRGCDRIVLLLTRPTAVPRTSKKDEKLAAGIRRKYPECAEKLRRRAERYNEEAARAKEYAAEGKVLIVEPDDTCGVSTLSRNPDDMKRLYEKGYKDGQKIKAYITP